ncbi:MAG TPA: HhH-GPD-type base excision DNA repair protein [Actinopolymorphaceae bacterium]|jgi:uncharacterized HhH-GPD family protein
MAISITGIPEADAELQSNPFALLVGMLLDQRIPMEKAFAGPYVLSQRMGEPLEPAVVASYDPDELVELFRRPPAIHRFPASMAQRVQKLAQYVVDSYDGDAAKIWTGVPTGQELLDRLVALPGYGRTKAMIFLALLGKQCGVRPKGWREAAGDYGKHGSFRSVADVVDPVSLAKVREFKKAMKASAAG